MAAGAVAATVAGVYAQALLEVAGERGRTAAVVESARDAARAITPEAIAALDDPKVGKARAKETLRKAWSGRVEPELVDLLCLLVDRDRLADAPAILAEAVRSADAAAGTVRVRVATAEALSSAAAERLSDSLRRVLGPGMTLSATVDPALIGGLTVRVGDTYVDGSVRRKLAEAHQRILDAPLGDLWDGVPATAP